MNKLYSNEIVFPGHPDKICDQISGAILDWCLKYDPHTRAGIETLGGKGLIVVTGEVTTNAKLSSLIVEGIVKRILCNYNYDADHYRILFNIGTQSHDIAQGVDIGGAGDQGMMFGYACNETDKFLPKAMVILQEFSKRYEDIRKKYPKLFYADGKAQITGVYDDEFRLKKIKTFLISYQNSETRRDLTDNILKLEALDICKKYGIYDVDEFLFNPTGKFLIGGFQGDAGLTGRKIVVDAYQSFANVGGGCMNGKDSTKVDFSAAHKARELAVRYLKEHNLKWCEVQLSYAIGKEEPLAIYIDSNIGNLTPKDTDYRECTPKRIIDDLGLLNINYEELAKFGHFTR